MLEIVFTIVFGCVSKVGTISSLLRVPSVSKYFIDQGNCLNMFSQFTDSRQRGLDSRMRQSPGLLELSHTVSHAHTAGMIFCPLHVTQVDRDHWSL